MKLPHAEEAVVSESKIVDYLLSSTHPAGQQKTTFFRGFGFTVQEWESLAAALRAHAREHNVAETQDTPHGTWYTLEGELDTPRGVRPRVRSVWIVDRGNRYPRLVTAYPLQRRRR